jgi:DnaJ homolog subfamily C member 28
MPNIEEMLRQAMADGKFDNLPGKGKPLHLDDSNPYTKPEWELAYHMLKDAGYSLPWIESQHEIDTDLESARRELRLAYEHFQAIMSEPSHSSSDTSDWERSQLAFKEKLEALNKRIRSINLQVPNARFQRPVLSFDVEIQRITSDRKSL